MSDKTRALYHVREFSRPTLYCTWGLNSQPGRHFALHKWVPTGPGGHPTSHSEDNRGAWNSFQSRAKTIRCAKYSNGRTFIYQRISPGPGPCEMFRNPTRFKAKDC